VGKIAHGVAFSWKIPVFIQQFGSCCLIICMKQELSERDIDRIIEMAWEDRTPFDAITFQFGLSEAEVIQLMRRSLKNSSWKRWRRRVSGRSTKHSARRSDGVSRFRSKAQKAITHNKISKKRY
jgi:uncharacterized protein (TIGR03643 family)